jgi:hypothetical protein
VVLYIHPWEVDPEQPRLPVSRTTQLRHRVGLATTGQKLRRAMRDFAFAPIAEVIDARIRGAVTEAARLAHAD